MPHEPIQNPVINSPFAEPQRHFKFTDTGITNQIVPGRRKSVYFVPIPKPKQRSGQRISEAARERPSKRRHHMLE